MRLAVAVKAAGQVVVVVQVAALTALMALLGRVALAAAHLNHQVVLGEAETAVVLAVLVV